MKQPAKSNDINFKSLTGAFKNASKYKGLFFFLFLAVIYGFILYRVNVLSSVTPDPNAVATKSTKAPHIDPTVVQKITDLQDNSVSVQTLFDQARQNPFQE